METPVPGNLVKTEYQKPGTGTGVPDFWIFQTRTESLVFGFPISRFFSSDFPVIFDTPS